MVPNKHEQREIASQNIIVKISKIKAKKQHYKVMKKHKLSYKSKPTRTVSATLIIRKLWNNKL